MKCPILFSEKNKKNISKCRLLKILPRVLSVNTLISVLSFYTLLYKNFCLLLSRKISIYFLVFTHDAE